MDSIRIVAELRIKPESLPEARELLKNLAAGSQAEAGNLAYLVTEDTKAPGHFFILEEWKSPEAITGHNATPHFREFQKRIRPAVENNSVTTLKRVF